MSRRMTRIVSIALIALALPDVAMAQGYEEHHREERGPPGGRPPGGGPPPPGYHGPYRGGPPPGGYVYRGHPYNPIHGPAFVYPPGWAYRRWAAGAILPPLFLTPAYYYSGWAAHGLPPPAPGFQWVRYGPDLIMVNVATGQVVDVVYGAFY